MGEVFVGNCGEFDNGKFIGVTNGLLCGGGVNVGLVLGCCVIELELEGFAEDDDDTICL